MGNGNIDREGQVTLEVISHADRFNRWMFDAIRPYCSGNILEIGSGIGNISRHFLQEGYELTLSDIRENYIEYLKEKFSFRENLEDILMIDLVDPDFRNKFSRLENRFDAVFALNVIEHISDDNQAIGNCNFLLKPGGKLIILVPAYSFLFNRFDEKLGHFRRYAKRSLVSLIRNNGFTIIGSKYFNLAGIAGWFISGKIQKNDTIPGSQMKLYNSLVPVFKLIDKLILNSAGLSVIVIGEK